MADENLSSEAEDDSGEDLWAAALKEQAIAEAATVSGTASEPAGGAGDLIENYQPAVVDSPQSRELEIILDIPVTLTVELGRTKISIRNLLQLAHGSVIELDGIAGEPLNVYVNGTLIAQGEVVVVKDKFGIRITDIITPADRIRRLQG